MSKAVTVIFSSFNGENSVEKTLEAFCNIIAPIGGWELIAVDNGSTDRTAVIMKSFIHRLPLRIIHEPTKGKNNALNAAISYIEGDLIVFTDDDVIPDPKWLCKLQNCAIENPEYGLFGGVIEPRWPYPPPSYLSKDLDIGMLYAATSPTLTDGEVANNWIWGGNMAVRRTIFDDGVRFHSSVGPDGTTNYMMGSEAEFTQKLTNLGIKSWFCKDARVEHIIQTNQLSKKWILQRYFRHGRSIYFFDRNSRQPYSLFFNSERWLYRLLVTSYLKTGWFFVFDHYGEWFKNLVNLYRIKGQIFQSKEMHRSLIKKLK